MGDVVDLFPAGEPDGEKPMTGYCAGCGCECSWPGDLSAWPESCPQGCTPFVVQTMPPSYTVWVTRQGVAGVMTVGPEGKINL